MNIDRISIYDRLINELLGELDNRKTNLHLKLKLIRTISSLMKDASTFEKENPQLVLTVENIIHEHRIIDRKQLMIACRLPDDTLNHVLGVLEDRGRLSTTKTPEKTVYSVKELNHDH